MFWTSKKVWGKNSRVSKNHNGVLMIHSTMNLPLETGYTNNDTQDTQAHDDVSLISHQIACQRLLLGEF